MLALDPTARTIRIGVEMTDKGYTQWEIPREGELLDFRQANLKDLGLDASRGKVEFMQADLSNMKDLYRGYDLILVNNLLEHSYDPAKFLSTVHERLNAGGLLVIACTNEWREDVTKKDNWIGGYKDATGENVVTRDGLSTILTQLREVREPVDVPLAIRRSGRSWDYALSQLTFWSLC